MLLTISLSDETNHLRSSLTSLEAKQLSASRVDDGNNNRLSENLYHLASGLINISSRIESVETTMKKMSVGY